MAPAALAPVPALFAPAPVSGGVAPASFASSGAPSRRGRFFWWEYTLDGKTFVAVDPTTVAHTTIAGLPPLTVVGFRVRVVDSTGPAAWSQVVSLVVH